jgi:hypothetical protein
MSSPEQDPPIDNWKVVEELRIGEMLLTVLSIAKNGLRRNSIDEVYELARWLKAVPRDQWPPEVERFVREFRRKPGRMRSARADANRFWMNPNKVAAFVAQRWITKWRAQHPGYKVPLADGSELSLRAAGVRYAVDQVNRSLAKLNDQDCGRRKVDEGVVKTLLAKGKSRPPHSAFHRGRTGGD